MPPMCVHAAGSLPRIHKKHGLASKSIRHRGCPRLEQNAQFSLHGYRLTHPVTCRRIKHDKT
eukprot:3256958-Alexandrium_andersonii.AAC.1